MISYFFAFTNKHTVWILGIFALILRLVNLDKSLWYDEGFSGHLSRLDVGSMIAFLTSEDVHPPLYFLLINLWEEVFPGDLALRWISVLLGSVSVMAFYGFSRKLFDQVTATIGTVFVALSPFHVHLSQEARPYALYMLLSVVALWLVVKVCESTTVVNRWGFAYSVTTALMLYTHNVAPLVVAGFASFHLCMASDNLRKALKQILLYNVTAAILFFPWALAAIRQADRADVHNWLPEVSIKSILTTMQWFVYSPPFYETGRFVHLLWLIPPTGLLISSFIVKEIGARRKIMGLALAILLPVALISLYGYLRSPVFVPRVLAPIIVPMFILLAAPLSIHKSTFLRAAGGLLAVAFLLFSTLSLVFYLLSRESTEWRGAAEEIRLRAAPRDAVIVMPAKAIYVFDYYFIPAPDQRVISVTDGAEVRELTEGLIRNNSRVWVVRDEIVQSGRTDDSLDWLKRNFPWREEKKFNNLTFISITESYGLERSSP